MGMETKICRICGIEKEVNLLNFYLYKNSKKPYYDICRLCQNTKLREWRKQHPLSLRKREKKSEYDIAYLKKHRESIKLRQRNFLWKQKIFPCVDCGLEFHPTVMQFDHINPENKYKNVSSLKQNKNLMLLEISKCELVCANCHAIRSYKRKQGMNIKQKIKVCDWGGKYPC